MKKNKGITLIALVVTIIILLILAGITLATLTGDNGLFARARQAKQNMLDAQERENLAIESYENAINDVIEGSSREEFVGLTEEQVRQIVREECKGITEEQSRNIAQEEFDKKIGEIEVNGIYDTLFEGNAYLGQTVSFGNKSINDYRYIIVYANVENIVNSSVCIDKSHYCIGVNSAQFIGNYSQTGWNYMLQFSFPTDKSLSIDQKGSEGWGTSPSICLIKGVK